MYQLCYASCATSDGEKLLEDLRNTLKEARDFNVRHQITGVLYFADGYFFQCLEGDKADLDVLCEMIKKDNRHKGFTLFEYKPIEKQHFVDWSMKYVKRNSVIQQYMRDHGFELFRPKLLQLNQVDELVLLLADIKD
ncbi:hypothetical protein A6M14_09880 [Acinetobacter sp. Ac_877]|uniref:BLUF domain-containing protein n=1 Tax=Acinetobacter portensis TaxID=1839785 RepID=UPI00128C25E3|nr:BLUF domain-containing protein [Acinetobacter portensis]MPW41777.1 hypothetical protein [Acinetobacter portensis]